MFNKEFLKTLTILYAEDDDSIRNSLGNILKKVFKEVIMCADGAEGVSNYELYTNSMDIEFDAIISDINMPNLNGLEMVKEIRKVNAEIPVIMTTAHGESNYLMEAIKVNVSGYTLKPIDTKELLMTIQKFCEIKRNQRLILIKEKELSEYMDLINGMSTILKVDNHDNIDEANPFFAEIAEAEQDLIVNTSIFKYLHKDSADIYKEMTFSIKEGTTWKGKLKFINEEGDNFFLRSTCIPRTESATGEVTGYISIGFLADDEEQEKQETLHKVRQSIMEQKQKVLFLSKKVRELQQTNAKFGNPSANPASVILKDSLVNEKKKNASLLTQVHHYEHEINVLKNKLTKIMENENNKRLEILNSNQLLARENSLLKDSLISLQNKLDSLKPKPKYVE
jgi:CheY-like chemotaxis protein